MQIIERHNNINNNVNNNVKNNANNNVNNESTLMEVVALILHVGYEVELVVGR